MSYAARLFFSFRSPFSWLTVERLQRIVPNALELIEFIPYWEPDARTARNLAERGAEIHYAQMSKAKHLYILQDTKRLAGKLGLPIVWPVDVNPWWEVPHLCWLEARRLGRGREFYAALTAARWHRGEDICELQVIERLAVATGLDGATVAAAVHDAEVLGEGIDCLVKAYEDDIFGVPYLRYGPHRFWGFDRLDDFLAVFVPAVAGSQSVARLSTGEETTIDELTSLPTELRSGSDAYDNDTAGGCG